MILISACLIGYQCNYKGSSNEHPELINCLEHEIILPICPELLGGLSVPRSPCEIVGGSGAHVIYGKARVLSQDGTDCTDSYLTGAHKVKQIAENGRFKVAILKKNSPSCGHGSIYDGTFSNNLLDGNGVAAEMLQQAGMEVYSEMEYLKLYQERKSCGQ